MAVLPTSLTVALTGCAIAVAARKVIPERFPEHWAWLTIVGAAVSVMLAIFVALLRRLPPQAGALALDGHHDLRGRLSNALAFSELTDAERSPFMTAAITDACRAAANGLSARKAVRIPIPPELVVSLAVGAGLAGLALLEVRTVVPIDPPKKKTSVQALDMSDDDLDMFREALRELEKQDQSAETREAVEKFNQLIEDIAEKRLTREEAFRKMHELEEQLTKGAEEEKKALDQALKQMANELQNSELSKPAADALKKKEMAQAREHLKKLAQQLRDQKKPDKAELERLKKALERASKSNKENIDKLAEKRAEVHSSLIKDKQALESKPQAEQEREKSLLKKKERELQRLDKQIQQRKDAARKLNKIDKALAKVAADLMRDLGASAEDLEKLTEDLSRLEQEEMSDKEKEDLRKRIQELRELIRQQGQGGDKMRDRLKKFMKKARGNQGDGQEQGQGKGKKKKGKGKGGQGQDGEGADGDLRNSGKGGGQDGEDGEGDGEDGEGKGKGLRIGKGGTPIPIDMPGGGGEQPGGNQPGGDQPGGKEAGHGSANKLGKESDINGETHDVQANALDNKNGPTNAEVIVTAAERGFTGKAYKKVHKEYQTRAEEQIEKEKVPDGMRFYVRRYFQLIRGRAE
jgi:chemotaxis protein histidine kinase CheA